MILCGGRGSRLRPLTDRLPKALAPVQGRPLLQHVIEALASQGFDEIVLPVGWKGERIRDDLPRLRAETAATLRCVDTGVDTPVARRLDRIRPLLEDHGSFLLVNGDTLFDLDLAPLRQQHAQSDAVATLGSVEITSRFGLIFESGGKVIDFERRTRVDGFRPASGGPVARINAGIACIDTRIFEHFDPATCEDFEAEVFPRLAREELLGTRPLRGAWHCVDTLHDLEAAQTFFPLRHPAGALA